MIGIYTTERLYCTVGERCIHGGVKSLSNLDIKLVLCVSDVELFIILISACSVCIIYTINDSMYYDKRALTRRVCVH